MKQIVLALLLVLSIVSISATQQKPPQWEYKFDYKCTERRASELGSEGWEMVNAHESGNGISALEVCAFKRPKS